eukprot:13726093-Alexandrium_andersonii.AAC.1
MQDGQRPAAHEPQRTSARSHGGPRGVACSAAVSACEEDGQWQAAFRLRRSMAESRLEPNAR